MRHLYNTRAEVLRLAGVMHFGTPSLTWMKIDAVADPVLNVVGEMMCRLDLTFVRPGKDQPMPIVAGRAPDRMGVLYFDTTDAVKAGDRIRTLSGPVVGTFEIRTIPDPAIDFAAAHHMEVQVVECSQALVGVFPGGGVDGDTL